MHDASSSSNVSGEYSSSGNAESCTSSELGAVKTLKEINGGKVDARMKQYFGKDFRKFKVFEDDVRAGLGLTTEKYITLRPAHAAEPEEQCVTKEEYKAAKTEYKAILRTKRLDELQKMYSTTQEEDNEHNAKIRKDTRLHYIERKIAKRMKKQEKKDMKHEQRSQMKELLKETKAYKNHKRDGRILRSSWLKNTCKFEKDVTKKLKNARFGKICDFYYENKVQEAAKKFEIGEKEVTKLFTMLKEELIKMQ